MNCNNNKIVMQGTESNGQNKYIKHQPVCMYVYSAQTYCSTASVTSNTQTTYQKIIIYLPETILKRTQFMVTACYVLLNVIQHDVHLFPLLMSLLFYFYFFFNFLSLLLLQLYFVVVVVLICFLFSVENMSFSPNFWSK